jgi:hypothetical protein
LYESFLVQVMYSKSFYHIFYPFVFVKSKTDGEEREWGKDQVENASGRKPLLRRTWTGGTHSLSDRPHARFHAGARKLVTPEDRGRWYRSGERRERDVAAGGWCTYGRSCWIEVV